MSTEQRTTLAENSSPKEIIEGVAKHTPHPEHRGLGFREPDDEEHSLSPASPKSSETKSALPAQRHYRDKRSSFDEDTSRPSSSRDRDRRDEPRRSDRSPPRDRDREYDRERSRYQDRRDSDLRSSGHDSRNDSNARSRGRERDREGERDRRSQDDRRSDYRRDDRRDERREQRHYERDRSASPTSSQRSEKIGDFKNWVPSVNDRGGRPRHDDAGDEDMPELYTILQGTVASVQSFGAFVKFEGRKRQGLVHVSQLSNYRVENPREMLAEGDPVWVKVIGVNEEDGKKKISLSMKLVNQTTGEDQDQNNVALMMSQRRTSRGSGPVEKGPIEFGHALPTTCNKCGAAGHMASECKVSRDGTQYELLPEPPAESQASNREHHHHHHKKEKKTKKEKKHKHKKHKKEKKDKKHKKHQSDSSSSSSSSD